MTMRVMNAIGKAAAAETGRPGDLRGMTTETKRQRRREDGNRGFGSRRTANLQRLDVRSLHALRAALRFETYFLTFCQRLEAVGANLRKVREKVIAAVIGRNKAKTLGVVKPLDNTGVHENPDDVLTNLLERAGRSGKEGVDNEYRGGSELLMSSNRLLVLQLGLCHFPENQSTILSGVVRIEWRWTAA